MAVHFFPSCPADKNRLIVIGSSSEPEPWVSPYETLQVRVIEEAEARHLPNVLLPPDELPLLFRNIRRQYAAERELERIAVRYYNAAQAANRLAAKLSSFNKAKFRARLAKLYETQEITLRAIFQIKDKESLFSSSLHGFRLTTNKRINNALGKGYFNFLGARQYRREFLTEDSLRACADILMHSRMLALSQVTNGFIGAARIMRKHGHGNLAQIDMACMISLGHKNGLDLASIADLLCQESMKTTAENLKQIAKRSRILQIILKSYKSYQEYDQDLAVAELVLVI